MIICENLGNGKVKIYSDQGKKLIDIRSNNEYSEAIVKEKLVSKFAEKE